MSLHRSPEGRLVRLGRTEQTLSWSPAFNSAMPSSLSTLIGTSTVRTANFGSASAHVQVAATAANGPIRQSTAQQIIPMHYEEIEFTLSGLRFSHTDGFNFHMEIYETTQDRGVKIVHNNDAGADTYGTIRAYSAAGVFTDHPTYYQFRKPNGGSQKPKSPTLLWRPRKGEVFVLEDDQVMAKASVPGEGNTGQPVKCLFTLDGVSDGTIKSVYWNRWDVTLRHN